MLDEIVINLKDALTKRYSIRLAGTGRTIEASLPREVIEREAKRLGLTIGEFLEKYEIEWLYDSMPGFHAIFRPINE